MVTFIVRMRAELGHEEDVAAELATMAEKVRADEPGCLAYFVHRLADEPDVFVIYEMYEDDDALERHRTSEHFRHHIERAVLPHVVERAREDLVLMSRD